MLWTVHTLKKSCVYCIHFFVLYEIFTCYCIYVVYVLYRAGLSLCIVMYVFLLFFFFLLVLLFRVRLSKDLELRSEAYCTGIWNVEKNFMGLWSSFILPKDCILSFFMCLLHLEFVVIISVLGCSCLFVLQPIFVRTCSNRCYSCIVHNSYSVQNTESLHIFSWSMRGSCVCVCVCVYVCVCVCVRACVRACVCCKQM